MIKTARKQKLPKGFSYPLGAAAISDALQGIPQFDNTEIWFRWRDEFWVSRWRKRLQARGPVILLTVGFSEYFGRWDINLYSVPSEYAVAAREQLGRELPRVRNELSAAGTRSKAFHRSITLSLFEAEIATGQTVQRKGFGLPAQEGNRTSSATGSRR